MKRIKSEEQSQPGKDFIDFPVSDTALNDFRRQGVAAGWPDQLGYRRTSSDFRLAARELSDDAFRKHILRGGGLYLQNPKEQRLSVLEQELRALHAEVERLHTHPQPSQQKGPAFSGVVEETPPSV